MSEHVSLNVRMMAVADLVRGVPPEDRFAILLAVLAREICTLPAGERAAEVQGVVTEFPKIFRVTEEKMRECRVDNAKKGMD